MGELHLDIYVERMKEYKVDVEVGNPRVNYRKRLPKKQSLIIYQKQSGGPVSTVELLDTSRRLFKLTKRPDRRMLFLKTVS